VTLPTLATLPGSTRDSWPVPLANCYVATTPGALDPDAVVEAWSRHSRVTAEEMTLNVAYVQQGGKRYAVIAWLYLPSLWSQSDVVALSEGLAAALVEVMEVEPSAVQVVTSIVASGSVVEAGKTVAW
jgi:hypothetical protein